jgi:hypothetical protein
MFFPAIIKRTRDAFFIKQIEREKSHRIGDCGGPFFDQTNRKKVPAGSREMHFLIKQIERKK